MWAMSCSSAMIFTSRVLLAIDLAIPSDEIKLNLGAWAAGVFGCSLYIPSYDVSCVYVLGGVKEKVVYCALSVVVYVFRGAHCVLPIGLVSSSSVVRKVREAIRR